ncbi:MAG: hypothetical protein Q9224_006784, partial [Gallowayella concinna]
MSSLSTALSEPTALDDSTASVAPTERVFNIDFRPESDLVCDGYKVEVNDIIAALTQGNSWATRSHPSKKVCKTFLLSQRSPYLYQEDKLIQMDHPGTKQSPHIYKNSENLDFPNCLGLTLWEYPILRHGPNPWIPSKGTPLEKDKQPESREPDRVVFAPKDPTSAIFCGVMTHNEQKLTSHGKPGAFDL